ncbi:hypothetical protein [Flexibacterium corallicola]|nr:hypothetical protein [Pseudovibrio sp. M1P-2-3]
MRQGCEKGIDFARARLPVRSRAAAELATRDPSRAAGQAERGGGLSSARN